MDTSLTLGGEVFGMLYSTRQAVQGRKMLTGSVDIKPGLHNEFRAMTNGVAAFSTATLLMILQGSFGELKSASAWAVIFFTAGIPICISASSLSFFFSHRKQVPAWADKALDTFMSLGWAGGIVGFGLLLLAIDSFLMKIFAGSIVFAFVVFVAIAYFVGEHDEKHGKDESLSNESEVPEAEQEAVEVKEA